MTRLRTCNNRRKRHQRRDRAFAWAMRRLNVWIMKPEGIWAFTGDRLVLVPAEEGAES